MVFGWLSSTLSRFECSAGNKTKRRWYTSTMTAISRDEVQHLAQLSSVQLSDDEVDSLQADISSILEYVQQLDELDTTGVEPTYQVTDLQNVWRQDVVVDSPVSREQLLALSKDSIDHQVKVPKVL